MSGFRLLGIRTGKRPTVEQIQSGSKDYFKILKEDTYYPFYSCFSYEQDTHTLTYHPDKDVDLYNLSDKVRMGKSTSITVSAVVGKNGTGKSTLIELLFLMAYHVGVAGRVLIHPETEQEITTIGAKTGVALELFFQEDKMSVTHVQLFYLTTPRWKKYSLTSDLQILELTDLAQTSLGDNGVEVVENSTLKELFYSIAVNYSIYGLNAKTIGGWINHLFHKNDAYQTPIVINPKRSDGNFNINLEESLAISRFLVNMAENNLQPHENEETNGVYRITEKQFVKGLTFGLDGDKLEYISINGDIPETFDEFYEENGGRETFMRQLYAEFIEVSREIILQKNIRFLEEIENYLVRKLLKITHVYPKQFGEYVQKVLMEIPLEGEESTIKRINNVFIKNRLNSFFQAIKKDKTHITLKIRQTIYFLKHPTLWEDDRIRWEESQRLYKVDDKQMVTYTDHKISMDLAEFAQRLGSSERNGLPLIEFLPPALFYPNIILGPTENENVVMFSSLSSGEQQQIHSVQSLLYHLRNLDSVHRSEEELLELEFKRTAYKNVTIILDEIELYAHPEMQRTFLDALIKGIHRIRLSNIQGISILIATHSPFILSDIPGQNILRLEIQSDGKSVPKLSSEQTFGANIHDLLANDFFLDKGFMGEFAKGRIQDLIHFFTYDSKEKIDDLNKPSEYQWSREESLQLINVIGEEILRNSLMSLHRKNFTELTYEELLAFYNQRNHDANQ